MPIFGEGIAKGMMSLVVTHGVDENTTLQDDVRSNSCSGILLLFNFPTA